MASKPVQVDFGERQLEIEVPGHAVVVEFQDPPFLPDPIGATRKALAEPLGSPPLAALARPGMRVAIAFDNPTRPSLPQQTILPVVVEQLLEAGVTERDILFICANGNHRKWTRVELSAYLGPTIFDRYWPRGQIVNHDCSEPPGLKFLGITERGCYVEHNQQFLEADLMIYSGNVSATNWGGYTGMGVVVGLASWRSMRSHHCYHVVAHPDSCTGDHTTMLYRSLKAEVNAYIEKATGKRIFYIDAVGGVKGRLAGVFAGYTPEVDTAAWRLAETFNRYPVPQADVLIIGLPARFAYGDSNNQLIAAVGALVPPRISVNRPVLREGGVIIGLSPCTGWINPQTYPSYEEVVDLYRRYHSVVSLSDHEEEFCHRPQYLRQYTHGYGYHPIHPFWLFYEIEYALNRAAAVIMAGTTNPGTFRSLGIIPAPDFAEAWRLATKFVGKDPVTVVAPSFWSRRLFKLDVQT